MNDLPPNYEIENQVRRLRPATASPALMERLRAARPSSTQSSAPPHLSCPPPATSTGRAWGSRYWPAAAAIALLGTSVGIQLFENRENQSAAERSEAIHSAGAFQLEPNAPPPPRPTVFLPVEVSRHLVSVHAVPATPGPDEAPRHYLRAVVMEDVTAVGAETDAALHWRRAREVFLPVHSPVY